MSNYTITQEAYANAFKPFEIVKDKKASVGMIVEVSVNESQPAGPHQIQYSVEWFVNNGSKNAWFTHDELTSLGNVMVVIVECMYQSSRDNREHVKKLFNIQ